MSLIRRVRDITIATLNERLEKAEDPVRLIDQFLWGTREEIIQAERLYQQYASHGGHLKQQWLQAEQQSEKREQQAMLALKADEENVARMALREKSSYDQHAAQYKQLYEESRKNIEELEELLQELRGEYQSVYDKREYYTARMESLRLQQRMNARYGAQGGSGQRPDSMFRRLEDRISDMELEARSFRDLRRSGEEFLGRAGASVQSVIESELEQLRRKLSKEG
ncbi:PspA/IM30 family protein [Paenibacillus sp. IB182496]|uniref:PspA/IM30 family protein n=1 Tax=Paenibacillus sabuli TaxID=2772509 RepID=A0A927BX03_9BACL|nr:PspA/IM30 family protein [Paenibacillus sabuli]MBD2847165.1 PspA/IM30 family protein [Paenibacillus sabuli]